MNFRRPPRIALWLLEHAWIGAYGEALTGDLIENYQLGRSRWWFWRQVGHALVIALIPSTLHKLLAAFGLVALGVGTFAWASVEKQGTHEEPACVQTLGPDAEANCDRGDLP
jgi:hypothetical protein